MNAIMKFWKQFQWNGNTFMTENSPLCSMILNSAADGIRNQSFQTLLRDLAATRVSFSRNTDMLYYLAPGGKEDERFPHIADDIFVPVFSGEVVDDSGPLIEYLLMLENDSINVHWNRSLYPFQDYLTLTQSIVESDLRLRKTVVYENLLEALTTPATASTPPQSKSNPFGLPAERLEESIPAFAPDALQEWEAAFQTRFPAGYAECASQVSFCSCRSEGGSLSPVLHGLGGLIPEYYEGGTDPGIFYILLQDRLGNTDYAIKRGDLSGTIYKNDEENDTMHRTADSWQTILQNALSRP